MGIKGKKKYL